MSGYVALGTVGLDRAQVFLMGSRSDEAVRLLLPAAVLRAGFDHPTLRAIHATRALSLDLVVSVLLRSIRLPAVGEEPAGPVRVDVIWFEPGDSLEVVGPFGLRFNFNQEQLPGLERVALVATWGGRSVVLGHGGAVTESRIEAGLADSRGSCSDGLRALEFGLNEDRPMVRDAAEFLARHLLRESSLPERP